MKLKDVHSQSLSKSTALSEYYVESLITPLQVIRVLNKEKIRFVLVGAHGLGGWMGKPRATEDVDVVVMAKHLRRATQALAAMFPHLEPEDHEVVVRLRDRTTGVVAIDLIKQRALFREVFKHTKKVFQGKEPYLVPSLEMALTMKFAAMLSPNRADKDKHLDAHDFMHMVDLHPEIDVEVLAHLGELVFGGGGKRLQGLVDDVRAGKKLIL